jgi:hypothetical protein
MFVSVHFVIMLQAGSLGNSFKCTIRTSAAGRIAWMRITDLNPITRHKAHGESTAVYTSGLAHFTQKLLLICIA